MQLADFLTALGFLLLVAAAGSIVWSTVRLGISPMPSSRSQTQAVLSVLPADFAGTLFELGAGWGTLAFALAKRFPHARIVAFEGSWIPWLFCWLRRQVQRRPNLSLRYEDFFKADWSEADIFVAYLFTGAMQRLGEALPLRARPGALLVTHTFAARALEPVSEAHVADSWRTPVMVYRCQPRTRIGS